MVVGWLEEGCTNLLRNLDEKYECSVQPKPHFRANIFVKVVHSFSNKYTLKVVPGKSV